MPRQLSRYLVLVLSFATTLFGAEDSPSNHRVSNGLVALYDFSENGGNIVKDRSGVGKPLDLQIADIDAVQRAAASLVVKRETTIRSAEPAAKIIDAVRRSEAITIEAWIVPANSKQSGPARIVSLSASANGRNFTLGQDEDHFDVRFRTTKTNTNGIPSVASPKKSLKTSLTHVVYVRNRSGQAKLFIDGKQNGGQTVAGSLSNWQSNHPLSIANEVNKGRPWLGTLHLVAIYSRSLSPEEIKRNFVAGSQGNYDPKAYAAAQLAARNRTAFETRVAALISNHCLECHDSRNKKGGLDLSKKNSALAGGDTGKAIVPGKLSDSLLWESIVSGEMPKERTPLSDAEKKQLRDWIEGGATWSLNVIDPATYAHSGQANDVWVQRLTVTEYIETVRSAVGVDIAKEAREILPKDLRADGFSNTAYNLNIDLKHVEAYAQLAETTVARMDALKFAKRFSKSENLSTDATMRDFVAAMGKWLLRGPLDDREVTAYCGIPTTVASAGEDYETAVSYLIEAMLQSPKFIYRIETQRGDGSAWQVGNYELASRLSYIIWGGPPDKQLMRAADDGKLDRNGVQQQVTRMLNDPRAIERSKRFIFDWLDLGRLDNLQPNEEKFPNWTKPLATEMREETLAFFTEVAWTQKRPLAELLNAQVTIVSPRLARHYGLAAEGDGNQKYDLSATPGRGGVLTHGSVLTVGGDEASMVTRGLFVLHDLLRGVVKDPPPCVDTRPVPTKEGLTQRGIAEQRIANANCGGCHAKFEPLAFGLEKFDGIGAYRDLDHYGNQLRDDGEILFPGAAKSIPYKNSAELMTLLATSDRIAESLTWKVTQFALGRPLVAADASIVAKIHESAQADGGTYSSLITAIVTSDLVQTTRTENTQ
ncbi:MAG: DUF1592 domain-containing protein [Planctomycetes bacterium]|nr:DUF1592 domain-containing protein [Planctomycetota bacterium]